MGVMTIEIAVALGKSDEKGTDSAKEAFCEHFEPTSKWVLYSVQCQSKKEQPDESWDDFVLAYRTFPELQEEALIGPFIGEVTN